MKQHSTGFVLGIIGSIILGFGVVAGVFLGLRSIGGLGYEPSVYHAQKTGPNSATLSISTFPDSHVCHPDADQLQSGWVTYCPTTSFEVPPNSLITVEINNYDSATTLINDYFGQVQGTIGGVEVVNGKPMSRVPIDDVAHTFTLQSKPNDPNPIFVSVPLVGVSSNANPNAVTVDGNPYPKPNVITFQFRTGASSTYIWHCYDPCGEGREPPFGFTGPMSTTGYMAGTLTVASY